MLMSVILFLESIGGGELMVVLLFVLMFFGSSKIPDLAKGLGRGMREFKDAMSGVQNEIRQNMSEIENTVKEETPVAVKPALSQPLHQEEAPTIEPVTENPAPKTHE